jgi:hypothetical protein
VGLDDIAEYWTATSSVLHQSKKLHMKILQAGGGGGGGVLNTGRVVTVTSRSHGLVAAPAIVVKSPTCSDGGEVTSTLVVVALLKEGEEGVKVGKEGAKEGELGYVGVFGGDLKYVPPPHDSGPAAPPSPPSPPPPPPTLRSPRYVVCEVDISNILYVTDIKKKFDASVVHAEKAGGGAAPPALAGGGAGGDFFGGAPKARKNDDSDFFGKPKGGGGGGGGGGDFFGAPKSRKNDDEDFFGGGKKKGGGGGGGGGKKGGGQKSFATEIDIVTAALTSVPSPPPLLDLRDCVRGVKGDPEFLELLAAYEAKAGSLFTYGKIHMLFN